MNAKNFHQISTARQNIQMEMFKFTDKLVSALGERCMCCRIRGFSDCPLRDSSPQSGIFPLYLYHSSTEACCMMSFHLVSNSCSIFFALPDSVDQARTPIGCKIAGKVLDMSAAGGFFCF
jgi:hypothetical protein